MTSRVITSSAELGRRIQDAREDASISQSALAERIGIDRTAIVRLEAGERKVSATELASIADVLDRPIDWFVVESPLAVVSRRRDPTVGGFSRRLDVALEQCARDIAFLLERGALRPSLRPASSPVPSSYDDAERLADWARSKFNLGAGPLLNLQSVAEKMGLYAFSLDLGDDAGDAAYAEVDSVGVAVINGATDAFRRRFSLAHEIGHHLVGDLYEKSPRVEGEQSHPRPGEEFDIERILNAFAASLLIPRSDAVTLWNQSQSLSVRKAALHLATRFCVSWSVACNRLRDLQLIDTETRRRLIESGITRGDILELGENWSAELEPPSLPPQYLLDVLAAYRAQRLSAPRTVSLLHRLLEEVDLPFIDEPPIELLRREFPALA